MLVDAEGALRAYLRAVVPELGGRAYFEVPKEQNPTMPLATVSRIGGGPQIGQVPVEDARLSIDVWGITKLSVARATIGVTKAILAIESVELDGQTLGYNGAVDSVIWAPDDTLKVARYVVDVTVTVRALD